MQSLTHTLSEKTDIGVRSIYTPGATTRVETLDDMNDGEFYLVSAMNKAVPVDIDKIKNRKTWDNIRGSDNSKSNPQQKQKKKNQGQTESPDSPSDSEHSNEETSANEEGSDSSKSSQQHQLQKQKNQGRTHSPHPPLNGEPRNGGTWANKRARGPDNSKSNQQRQQQKQKQRNLRRTQSPHPPSEREPRNEGKDTRRIHSHPKNTINKPKRIVVFKNGDVHMKHMVLLNPRSKYEFDNLMMDITDMFQMRVLKLFTTEGFKVGTL